MGKFAIIVFDGKNKIVDHTLIRTSRSKDKKYSWINYYTSPEEQVNHVVDHAISFLRPYLGDTEAIAIEGLSFASTGNATRDLAGVFHTFVYTLCKNGFDLDNIYIYPPITIKKYAKMHIEDLENMKGKDFTIAVAERYYPDFIGQFVKSATSVRAGKDDYSDALCAHITRIEKTEGGFNVNDT